MIIYGWSNRVIKEAPIEKIPCEHCGDENVKVKITGFYAHIFWIPLFPYKKKGYLECEHCKNTVDDNKLGDQMKEIMSRMKNSVKFPKYMFSGSAIFIAFIAWIFINSRMENSREIEYISNPQVGDVYHLKNKDEPTEYKYYLWKTVETFEDSIYFIQNAYGYNQIPSALLEDDGFVDAYYVIDKDFLRELFDLGEIVKVQRKYSERTGFDKILEYTNEDSVLLE